MTRVPKSKLPVPVEVTGFHFLTSSAIQTHAVLELRTSAKRVRFFLTKPQLQELASKARLAASMLLGV